MYPVHNKQDAGDRAQAPVVSARILNGCLWLHIGLEPAANRLLLLTQKQFLAATHAATASRCLLTIGLDFRRPAGSARQTPGPKLRDILWAETVETVETALGLGTVCS